jgi:hypothetical protein
MGIMNFHLRRDSRRLGWRAVRRLASAEEPYATDGCQNCKDRRSAQNAGPCAKKGIAQSAKERS